MPRPSSVLLPLLLATAHCERGSSTTTPADATAATPTPAAPTTPAPATAACRDWSKLDLASLPALPASPHTPLFEQVWTTVLQRHYDPTLGCLDWPALRTSYGAKVAAAKTDADAFAAIGELLGELEQSHLGLVPPAREAAAEPAETRPMGRGQVPLTVTMLGDEVVVATNAWHGKTAPVPAGATILSIDGHELAPHIADASARWPTRRVERDFHVVRTAAALLSCDAGQSHTLRWVAPGRSKPTTKAVRCHVPERRTATFGNLRDVPVEVETKLVAPGVGYLRFNIWLMDLSPEIERGIAELRAAGMTSLVIDLRGNPGGIGAMVVPVGRLLLDRDADLGVMRMRGAEQRFAVKRGADPFPGQVAVLIDAGTASTSEIFAQSLKDLGRARIYGASESQGAALPSLIERLDGGALLQYVVADYTSPGGVAVEGKGVEPDLRVAITRDDLAAGRDPVLAAAIAGFAAPATQGDSK